MAMWHEGPQGVQREYLSEGMQRADSKPSHGTILTGMQGAWNSKQTMSAHNRKPVQALSRCHMTALFCRCIHCARDTEDFYQQKDLIR